jgi:hypothetical protein
MSNEAKEQYTRRIRDRYQKASREAKKAILDEFCQVCGYHRKYAIRKLGKQAGKRGKKPGRALFYSSSLIPHIRHLWFTMEQIGSRRMKQALKLWLKFYTATPTGEVLSDRDRQKLKHISVSTLERLLSQIRKEIRGKGTTKVDKRLKAQVPVGILDYRVTKPGAVQADTVSHLGFSVHGEYAHTLTVTDVYSGWTENRAIFTKDSKQVVKQVKLIEAALPFKIHTFASDCGTEFINFRVMAYLLERAVPINMIRSRPYHKDDNAYVEQKNWTHVRSLFGYDRIESEALIEKMNSIYAECWNPLHNFFLPSIKLVSKERIAGKLKKRYDHPKTPCQRLLESAQISDNRKKTLRAQQKSLNPFELKAELEKRLKQFFSELSQAKDKPKAA